ncbi:MAG: hypothetical protein ACTHZ5_08615 [Micrococcaceae bacterium]
MTEPQNRTGERDDSAAGEVVSRLNRLLRSIDDAPLWSSQSADTAPGWLDLAHEAAYADDQPRARRAVAAGLNAPGSERPEHRLALYRTLATVLAASGEDPSEAIRERAAVLREVGQPHQAELEVQLGSMLLREPESFDASVLAGVVDQEREADPRDTVLVDTLVALSVARVEEQRADDAVELLREALRALDTRVAADAVVSSGQRTSVTMFLAHVLLMHRDGDAAAATATELLESGCNRAVRAAMWMVRAVVAQQSGQWDDAAEYALRSCELYARLGVRPGAASSAGLLATVSQNAGLAEQSVLAWRLAMQQAEQGEITESVALGLALGHQLLEIEDYREAEEVLTGLVRRAETMDDSVALGRALVDLGHALRHQGRAAETLEQWDRAAALFTELDFLEEAARVHLATGALLSREQRQDEAVARLTSAVEIARQLERTEAGVLPQALHALGHVLSERGDADGVRLLDEAIELAKSAAADWHHADYTDTRARALWALHDGPAAVSTALTAADLYAASNDRTAAQQAELFAAHVLLEQGKAYEASSLFRLLAEDTSTAASVRMAAWLGLAQALELTDDEPGAAEAKQRADEIAGELSDDEESDGSDGDDGATSTGRSDDTDGSDET